MKKTVLFLMSFVFLFAGCKKENVKKQNEYLTESADVSSGEIIEETSDERKYYHKPDYLVLDDFGQITNTSYHTDAHSKYLKDEMRFEELPYSSLSGKTYLVASNYCELYSEDCFTDAGDDRFLPKSDIKGEPISLGTVLEATDEMLKGPDTEYNDGTGLIKFQDNWNYFYGVRYGDKTGYVFGADLHYYQKGYFSSPVINTNPEQNCIYSELLKNNGVLDKFYSYTGDQVIGSNNVKDSLQKNRIAMRHYEPEHLSSDDLIDSYSDLNEYTPVFITTDLFSHSQHLVFDRILQRVEQNFFIPKLLETCQKFISVLQTETDVTPEVKELAIKYFQVGELILRLTPEIDEDGKIINEPDRNKILSEYPDDVKAELQQIENASGEISEIFGIKEMFNQYKPRGHYTKNKALEGYFKAQMWFGRIHFVIAMSNFNPETNAECTKMEPVAMFIVNTVKKNSSLYSSWTDIFDPITTLIGECDDISIKEILPLWESLNVENFSEWSTDKEKLSAFVKLCHEKLDPPAIAGNSVFYGPSEGEERKPPMGWRFLGQRFTYDSFIHNEVSSPRVMGRQHVRGLDVMKVFGSKTAESLINKYDIEISDKNDSLFFGGDKLKDKLGSTQKAFDSLEPEFWTKNYYNSVLSEIRNQATFEQGAGFYFTEAPLWNIKSMISSHSTWAELRHDTILYVKQSCAEMAGGGDLQPTFRTISIPLPVNYIEPNLPFWQSAKLSVTILKDILFEYGFTDNDIEHSLKTLYEIADEAVSICKKEADDKNITDEENRWITTIPSQLASSVLLKSYAFTNDKKELQMACIADVFTNSETNLCLEVGVAKPVKLYVALNDGQGGKRIAVGFISDYVEFYHDANDRMTDDAWKEMVYNKNVDTADYEPFWEKSCILPRYEK